MAFRIRIEKENFKFSCSHFTIFGQGHAESLHGHNYYVSVEVLAKDLDPTLGLAFDFNLLKPLVRKLTEHLDERVLIPNRSPYLKVEKKSGAVRVTFDKKSYEFPEADVLLLDLVNVTSEELARKFANDLIATFKSHPPLKALQSLTIGVQETRGQTVFYETDV